MQTPQFWSKTATEANKKSRVGKYVSVFAYVNLLVPVIYKLLFGIYKWAELNRTIWSNSLWEEKGEGGKEDVCQRKRPNWNRIASRDEAVDICWSTVSQHPWTFRRDNRQQSSSQSSPFLFQWSGHLRKAEDDLVIRRARATAFVWKTQESVPIVYRPCLCGTFKATFDFNLPLLLKVSQTIRF